MPDYVQLQPSSFSQPSTVTVSPLATTTPSTVTTISPPLPVKRKRPVVGDDDEEEEEEEEKVGLEEVEEEFVEEGERKRRWKRWVVLESEEEGEEEEAKENGALREGLKGQALRMAPARSVTVQKTGWKYVSDMNFIFRTLQHCDEERVQLNVYGVALSLNMTESAVSRIPANQEGCPALKLRVSKEKKKTGILASGRNNSYLNYCFAHNLDPETEHHNYITELEMLKDKVVHTTRTLSQP